MNHKAQHVIPKCYLKAWCDPECPENQTPYVWLVSTDGKSKKRKSPEKAFVSTDPFTIRLPDGERELRVEHGLSKLEDNFVRLLKHRIERKYALDPQDRGWLACFAAAMHMRSNNQAALSQSLVEQIKSMVALVEQSNGLPPRKSQQLEALKENLRPETVANVVPSLTQFYLRMNTAIFVAPDSDPFITSDTPSVWSNPEKYKLSPGFRGPGLAQRDIEVTLPLTPKFMMFLSHQNIFGYCPLLGWQAQEYNRRTRFTAKEYFVSLKGDSRPEWFDPGTPPEDRWENSPKAKLAEERSKAFMDAIKDGFPETLPVSLLDARRDDNDEYVIKDFGRNA